MERFKQNIYNLISVQGAYLSSEQQSCIDKILDAIDYAWNNWDSEILATYYTGEKPTFATKNFIENWIENEDFQADGYDEKRLIEIFE